MLTGLTRHADLAPLHAYAQQRYGGPSTYTWTDETGVSHCIRQAEGGEQGNPLMPALYSLAQHPALAALQPQLEDGEAVFAYLDDVYILAHPHRIRPLYNALAEALWHHARVQLNAAKTRVWNMAGEKPPHIQDLQPQDGNPIWVGNWALPPVQQGLQVLGAPIGTEQR